MPLRIPAHDPTWIPVVKSSHRDPLEETHSGIRDADFPPPITHPVPATKSGDPSPLCQFVGVYSLTVLVGLAVAMAVLIMCALVMGLQ